MEELNDLFLAVIIEIDDCLINVRCACQQSSDNPY